METNGQEDEPNFPLMNSEYIPLLLNVLLTWFQSLALQAKYQA
jgi:hypothetical protein